MARNSDPAGDALQSVTVISQGGLDSTENHLILDAQLPGGASRLLNYEVGLYGGYRRINGYEYWDSNYPTVDDTNAEGKILGLFIYTAIDGTETVYAARKQKSGNTYKIYSYDSSTGWTAITAVLTLNTVSAFREIIKIRTCKVSIEGVSYIILVDGVNVPIVFDGTSWTQPTGDQSLAAPQYVTAFRNHIFFGGDAEYIGVLYHSAPEDPTNYNVASGAGQLSAGFRIDGIKPFRENLFVFGNQSLRKIIVDDNTLDFLIKDVATNIGVIAPDSIIEMNGDILFLAQDGVRTVSGTDKIGDINLGSISKQIQKLVNTIQDNYDLSFLNSTVIKKKSQFRYFISANNVTAIGSGIIGGLRTINGQSGWEFAELSGIRTSCVENDYIDNIETTLHGDYDGAVYIQETGNSFNGEDITSIYSTPFLTFGDVLSRKTLRKIHTFMRPEGSLSLNIKASVDWMKPTVTQPTTLADSTQNVLYLYDEPDTTYDDPSVLYDSTTPYPIVTTECVGSFNSVRVTYTSSGIYASHTIQGFICEFNPEGTRTI